MLIETLTMEALHIPKTDDTPEVKFSPEQDVFEISYRSLPENAIEFYQPICKWVEEYNQSPNQKTTFDFKLEYFNTASAKQIAKLLLLLEKLAKSNEVLVNWHYDKEDSDMLMSGKRYAKLIKLNFAYIER